MPRPAAGGRATKRHILGAPELIAKRLSRGINASGSFLRFAAMECLNMWSVVFRRESQCTSWNGRIRLNLPGPNNILWSSVFPGLCLNATALAANETVALRNTLQSGFKRPDHKAFVERLAKRRSGP